jgi:hypothetical protein
MQGTVDHDLVAAGSVFGFLADTLTEMAHRIARLETHAEDMIHGSPRRAELLVVLQDFDLVRQVMEDCASLCLVASGRCEGHGQGLVGTLRLEALRERLLNDRGAGARHRIIASDDRNGSGAVDFFHGRGAAEAEGANRRFRSSEVQPVHDRKPS